MLDEWKWKNVSMSDSEFILMNLVYLYKFHLLHNLMSSDKI